MAHAPTSLPSSSALDATLMIRYAYTTTSSRLPAPSPAYPPPCLSAFLPTTIGSSPLSLSSIREPGQLTSNHQIAHPRAEMLLRAGWPTRPHTRINPRISTHYRRPHRHSTGAVTTYAAIERSSAQRSTFNTRARQLTPWLTSYRHPPRPSLMRGFGLDVLVHVFCSRYIFYRPVSCS